MTHTLLAQCNAEASLVRKALTECGDISCAYIIPRRVVRSPPVRALRPSAAARASAPCFSKWTSTEAGVTRVDPASSGVCASRSRAMRIASSSCTRHSRCCVCVITPRTRKLTCLRSSALSLRSCVPSAA